MKKIISISTGVATAIAMLAFAMPAAASVSTNWNVTGHYVSTFVLGGDYAHDMDLVQDLNGNVTGSGGYPAGGPYQYHWNVTSGTVVGDQINLTALYDVGAAGTVMHMIGTIASDGTISGIWDDNFGGSRNGTWSTTAGAAVALNAQDFGVMNFSGVKGYTAGFGLTNTTLAGAQSVVVQLYSGTTLLQTNTAIIPKFNTDIAGTQFSSPFDVFGTFNYPADGYWTNVRETEYGQTLIPDRVVATVTLADGRVVTAENTNLTGDPTTIFPLVTTNPATAITQTDATLNGTNGGVASDGESFWVSTSPIDTSTPNIPANVYSTPVLPGVGANVAFSDPLSLVTTNGIVTGGVPGNMPAVTPNTTYYFVAWSFVNGTWTPGEVLNFTTLPVPPTTPGSKEACMSGGWKTYTDGTNHFKNQGDCVSFVATKGKNKAAGH